MERKAWPWASSALASARPTSSLPLTWAGEEQLPVGLATRLLAHGVGLALGLDLLALGDDLGLPALLFGLLDFGFGSCRGVDGSPVLFGLANVVDLEIDGRTNGAWRGPPQGHAGLRSVS
jgi:hypothetical protein